MALSAQEIRHMERPKGNQLNWVILCDTILVSKTSSRLLHLFKKSVQVCIILSLIMSHVQSSLLLTKNYLATITKVIEHNFYSKAIKDPHWWKAMAEEIKALEDNATWELVDL